MMVGQGVILKALEDYELVAAVAVQTQLVQMALLLQLVMVETDYQQQ
jgi:hypothetical protein